MSYAQQAYYMALYGALGALLGWTIAALLLPYIQSMSPVEQRALMALPLGGLVGAFLSLGAFKSGGAQEQAMRTWTIGLLVGVVGGFIGGAVAEGFFFYVFDRGGLAPRLLAWGILGVWISMAPVVAAYFTVSSAGQQIKPTLKLRHRLEARGASRQQIASALIGGWFGGALGGAWLEMTQTHASAWTHLGAFLLCGAGIGIGRTALHGIITFAHFTGRILGDDGKLLPADKRLAVKQHVLDGHSEKLIGTGVDTGSQVRMYPVSECRPEHARVFPRGGRLWIEAKDGELFNLDGSRIIGPQPLMNGFQFRIGRAVLTYHEQRR